VNEDQLYDAAEREMDLYREQLAAAHATIDRMEQELLDSGDEIGRLRALVASREPLSVKPSDDAQPAPELQAVESAYLYHWRFERGEEFGLYRHAADANAKAAEHAGDGLTEVLGMAILGRPVPQPAPGLAAYEADIASLTDQRNRVSETADHLREVLDEIGVMAANAPEDGDSFGVLEEIAMRIAAVDVPDSAPEAAAAPELAAKPAPESGDAYIAELIRQRDETRRLANTADRAARTGPEAAPAVTPEAGS
jgi:hypothetical protein